MTSRSGSGPVEISVTGFLREFLEQHTNRPNRPFCWVLGAGASVSSGIPAAGALARQFLERLYEDVTDPRESCEDWIRSGGLGIEGFDPRDPAKHYAKLYERCYGDCPDAGYAFLEEIMRNKRPGYGYAVLAVLLATTQHRIVITTNFDNLIADAVSAHSTTFPRVVGHVQLTDFVQTELRRPLVAKIHGDLGFRTSNLPEELSDLDRRWADCLTSVFKRFTPVVIGYGGNDQTLMRILRELPDGTPDRIYWCAWDREQPSDDVRRFLSDKRGAKLVRHRGFDELMLQVEACLRRAPNCVLPDLVADLEQRQRDRLEAFRRQRQELAKAVASVERPSSEARAPMGPAETRERQALAQAAVEVLAPGGDAASQKDWWRWLLEAQAATPEQRDDIFRSALEALPRSPELLASYAGFLCDERRDLDRAEALYQRAIEAEPRNPNKLGSYADFLRRERRDLDRAETLYQRAIEADPTHASHLVNYANFLWQERRDLDRAETFYQRAVEADPTNASHLGNYARLLLARGQKAEGVPKLEAALARVGTDAGLLVELWFYAFAHARDRWPDALARLKGALLLAGGRSKGWRLDDNIARARADGHGELPLLQAVAAVISEDADPGSLDRFETWRSTMAISPWFVPESDQPKATRRS